MIITVKDTSTDQPRKKQVQGLPVEATHTHTSRNRNCVFSVDDSLFSPLTQTGVDGSVPILDRGTGVTQIMTKRLIKAQTVFYSLI